MKWLDRYVSSFYLKVWAVCVFGAPFLFIIFKLTDDLDKYLSRGLAVRQIMLAYLFDFPNQMSLSLPVASLFGAVFTVALMSRHSEVTAAKASGISFYRLIAPLIVLGTLVSIGGLALNELVPETNRLRAEALGERSRASRGIRNQFVYGSDGGRAYTVRRLVAADGLIQDIVIDQEGTGSDYPTYRVFAPSAKWEDTHWVLLNGYLDFFPTQDRMMTFAFDSLKQRAFTETPEQLLAEQKDPEEMNYAELGSFIESIQRSGGDARSLEVERMLKIAIPMACLVVVLFGSALGNSTGRAGPAMGIGIALGTVLVYLLVVRVGQGMGAGGIIPPGIAAWLPNFLFLGIGLGLLWRTRT